jgi:DNA-binding NarL/FixJ family response regulator
MNELTKREIEILEYACNGYSNEEISKELCISHYTVKAHLDSILRKSNVKNLIKFAEILNLIEKTFQTTILTDKEKYTKILSH